jgi:hypothetical protein
MALLVIYLSNMLSELTSWRRNLTEKLIFVQLVEKFPTFYGTRRFIIAFTRTRHWTLTSVS